MSIKNLPKKDQKNFKKSKQTHTKLPQTFKILPKLQNFAADRRSHKMCVNHTMTDGFKNSLLYAV